MKKVLFLFVALFATITMSAQTLEKSNFFDNTYVGLNTGVSGWRFVINMNFVLG